MNRINSIRSTFKDVDAADVVEYGLVAALILIAITNVL